MTVPWGRRRPLTPRPSPPTPPTRSIDALLGGGLRVAQLAEVCGESGAGKTQLCLSLAAQCAARAMRVAYVDTGAAFTAARFRALLRGVANPALVRGGGEAWRAPLAGRQSRPVLRALAAAGDRSNPCWPRPAPQGLEEAQQCVTLHRVYDVHALLAVVDALLAQHSVPAVPPGMQEEGLEAAEAEGEEGPLLDLVIVDSLGALIAPVLGGGQHNQGHALLAAAAGGLKRLAAAAGVPVVVTNHLVGGDDAARGEKRPALGESWRNQPHLRLQLTAAAAPEGDPYVRSAAEPCWASLRYSTARGPAGPAPFWVTPARLLSQPPPPQQQQQQQQQQQAQRMDVG